MALTKDEILAAPDLKPELVDVPEWGGSVWLRGLSAGEYMAFSQQGQALLAEGTLQAWLVAKTLIDETGTPLFTEDGVKALAQKSGKVIKTLAEHVMKLSGLATDDIDDKKPETPIDAALGN